MNKYFGMFALSIALVGGCSPADENPGQTGSIQQKLAGGCSSSCPDCCVVANGNTPNQYTATSINTCSDPNDFNNPNNRTPIRGIHSFTWYGSTYWYVMTQSNDYAAYINSITYRGLSVTELSSSQGWFNVMANGGYGPRYYLMADNSNPLVMHVTSPFNGTIQISYTGNFFNSGARYSAVFIPDAYPSRSAYMDPVDALYLDGTYFYTQKNGTMVPVAGTKWDLITGAATTDANAITFSSSIDAVGACIGWGYEPWATYSDCSSGTCYTYSMSGYHQACMRMKRADFCGDGRSWTKRSATGYALDFAMQIWDDRGINPMAPMTPALSEAYWINWGAWCVNMNQLRSLGAAMTDGMGHIFDAATSCGYSIPPCANYQFTGATGSSPPCAQRDASGTTCTATTTPPRQG